MTSANMRRLSVTCLVSSLIALVSTSTPYQVAWNSTHSYGPDGPWPVVTIQVGTDAHGNGLDTVDLHPGGIWQHMIPIGKICNGQPYDKCPAAAAGLYDVVDSHNIIRNVTPGESGVVWQWGSEIAQNLSGLAYNVVDVISLHGALGSDSNFQVGNSSITAVEAWTIELPDGTNYSTQVGTLALGAPGKGNEPFSNVPNFGNVNGQTIPGYGNQNGNIPSNSFGLHYGSVPLNQTGSLVFGGYDQSRVLGDAAAFDLVGEDNQMITQLLDIEIGVETGSTPFTNDTIHYPGPSSSTNITYISGLLQRNASFPNGQPTVINPIVPYFFMSPQTCANIAQNLPVTFQSDIGLYTWDTNGPAAAQYQQIRKSPAYLAFVFDNPGASNITIKVPFALLDLTLDAPIVSTPQQYFPCRPFYANDGSGYYEFGKAFLQAAFIGMNWGQNKWFMAQAPGPGVGASNVQPIGDADIAINSDPISNFATTWAKDWTAVSQSGNGTTGASAKASLSTGAKAGIGVGVALVGFALLGTLIFLVFRSSRLSRQRHHNMSPLTEPLPMQSYDPSNEYEHFAVQGKDVEPVPPHMGNDIPHEVSNESEVQPIFELGDRDGRSFHAR